MNDHLKDHFFVLHGLSPINGSTVLSSVQLGEAGGGGGSVSPPRGPPLGNFLDQTMVAI